MKKIPIISSVVLAGIVSKATAQVHVGLHVNIGSPGVWESPRYESAQYYYLPEIETYYCVPRRDYIYRGERGWIHSSYLPQGYHHFDVRHARRIAVERPAFYSHRESFHNHFAAYREPRYYREARPARYGGHAYSRYREHEHEHRW